MTYGQFLDRASDAIRAAGDAAANTGASGHTDLAATVSARTGAYQQLVRLVEQLGGPVPYSVSVSVAERLVNSKRRLGTTATTRMLAVGLRAAYVELPTFTPARAATAADVGLVASPFAAAAEDLGAAADLLAGHIGHPLRRPRTPEGRAISAGTGHPGAVAELARIATELIDVDRRLLGWLTRGQPAATLRPVYAPVADRLRWWTRGPYPQLLHRVVGSANGESVLRMLDIAPATERSTGARPVASLRDVLRTLDAARAWLEQHPRTTHLAHARAAARLAVTITRGAAITNPDAGADAHRWQGIAKDLHSLGELRAGNRDDLVAELLAANDWLQQRLGANQTVRSPGGASGRTWRETLSTLGGRLPALAKQIDSVVLTATLQGQLCVPNRELDMSAPRRGVFVVKTSWRRARHTDRQIQTLRRKLRSAARTPDDHEQALRQAIGAPISRVRASYTKPPTPGQADGGPSSSPATPARAGTIKDRGRGRG